MAPVRDGGADGRGAQRGGSAQPAETAANDDHVRHRLNFIIADRRRSGADRPIPPARARSYRALRRLRRARPCPPPPLSPLALAAPLGSHAFPIRAEPIARL